jgi:hypothetical protein
VPDRHGQIAAGSTVLSGDGRWTSFTIHPPNYPRFVEWAERDIGPTVLARPEWSDPVHVSTHRLQLMAVVAELAAAETRLYGSQSADRDYAAGLEHAVMWAVSATPAMPSAALPGPAPSRAW